MADFPSIDREKLRVLLEKRLPLAELKTLTDDLGVDYEALPHDKKPDLVRELLRRLDQLARPLSDLTDWLRRNRPDIDLGIIRVSSPLHQLPSDLADFTGRADETAALLTALGSPRGGAAAISAVGGMGGAGKSALAVHAAHRLAATYPDAQIVVDMRGVKEAPLTPAQAMAAVIRAFAPEAKLPDEEEALAPLYREVLSGKRALLLLDDAKDSAQVKPLIPPAGCGLLVTSRHRIVLPGAARIDLEALKPEEALALLCEISSRCSTGLRPVPPAELSPEDALIAEIAKLCAYLPLALRAAGTYLALYPDWSAADYAVALRDERTRLERLHVEDLDVEAVLSLSAKQLVREDRTLAERWEALSVMPAPFDRAGAAAVMASCHPERSEGPYTPTLTPPASPRPAQPTDALPAWVRDSLSALVSRALLLYDAGSGLYRLHDLLRPVAARALEVDGEDAGVEERLREAERRHAEHYLAVGSAADDRYREGGAGVLEGLRAFDAAWPHLEAAWGRWKGREEAARWTCDFPGVMPYVLDLRLPPRQLIPYIEAALAAARALGDRQVEGAHLGNLGGLYADLGDARRAIEYYEQALPILREIGDRRGEGNALGNLGLAYAALGDARRAIDTYEQALVIDREIGDRRGEGNALGNLGLAYAALGDARRAIEYYEQALVIAREIGDRRGEGNDLGNLGNAYLTLGDARRAIDTYEQALVIDREIGDRRGEGNALGNLGIAYADLGEPRRAIGHYEQQLVITREIGDRRGEGAALGNLGIAYADLGEPRRAIGYYEQQLVITREIGDRRGEGNALGNLGLAYAALGDARRAIDTYEQALVIDREIGDRDGEAKDCWNMGLLLESDDPARAADLMQLCVDFEREIGHPDAEKDAARVADLRKRASGR